MSGWTRIGEVEVFTEGENATVRCARTKATVAVATLDKTAMRHQGFKIDIEAALKPWRAYHRGVTV